MKEPLTHITVSTFSDWCENARPGDVLIYHFGHLAYDRGGLPTKTDAEAMVDAVADAAMEAYDFGRVTLTQARVNRRKFIYLAFRR